VNAVRNKQKFAAAVIAATCFLSTNCDSEKHQAAWWQGERERVELEQAIALKSYRLNQSSGGDPEALKDLTASVQKSQERLEELRQYQRDLQREVASIESEWPQVRDELLRGQRERVIGKTLASLKSTSGREYKNVTVARIDDAGVMVRHDAGSARLRAGDLDAEQQAFFGLDTALAMVAEKKEQQEGAAYDQWIDKQLVAVKDAEERKLDTTDRETGESERMRSRVLARQNVPEFTRPLAQGSSLVSSRFSRFSDFSPGFRRTTPSFRYYYIGSNGYSCNSGFAAEANYVGSNRPNSPVNPLASSIRAYGWGSSCPTPRVIYSPQNCQQNSPQNSPDSPVSPAP
jgi:hypothetical protein